MSEDWKNYVNDPRIICKYGVNCYQKNAQHHSTYKHPPQNIKRKKTNKLDPNKKHKAECNSKQVTSQKNIPDDEKNVDKNDEMPTQSSADTLEVDNLTKIEDKTQHDKNPLPKNITYYNATKDGDLLKELFLVSMPTDFFNFYQCIKEDCDALKMLTKINLELIGPFDLLLGKLPIVDDKDLYLIHWRFYFDPPEFQVSTSQTNGLHWLFS